LARHLTRCNGRPVEELPHYHELDVNVALRKSASNFFKVDLSSSLNHWPNIIARIRSMYTHLGMSDIPMDVREHELFQDVVVHGGKQKRKHAKQHASFLAHLEDRNLLQIDNDLCYMEFGCGRAELSAHMAHALARKPTSHPCAFTLIDRDAHQNRCDRYIRQHLNAQNLVDRIRIDIKDFNLKAYQHPLNYDNMSSDSKIVAISKHLCGAATDLTLRCLMQAPSKVQAMMIAVCCHHRCKFEHYVDPDYLAEMEIEPHFFQILSSMSAWATCKPDHPKNLSRKQSQIKNNQYDGNNYDDDDHVSGLTIQEREDMGLMCKRILDFGRLRFLRAHGFDIETFYYCDQETTLENFAVLAQKK